jgi:predicted site-specific integrase-resolvase
MNDNPVEPYVSRKELAKQLGVGIATICRWESHWVHFPTHRMGGRVMYLISEVDRFWLTHKGHEKGICPRLSSKKSKKGLLMCYHGLSSLITEGEKPRSGEIVM